MGESSTDVGVYRGVSNNSPGWWTNIPGTYYWQLSATWTDYPPYPALPIYHTALSAIFTVSIQAPAPAAAPAPAPAPSTHPTSSTPSLAMATSDAQFYVRDLIRGHTPRAAHGLHYGCARLTSRSFRCRPSWYDRRYLYAGTATLTHFSESGQVYPSVSFTGKRASRACLKHATVKRCARSLHWSA